MFKIQSPLLNLGSLPPARPPALPVPPPSAPSPHKASGGNTGRRVPLMRRYGPEGAALARIGGGKQRCGVTKVRSDDQVIKCE